MRQRREKGNAGWKHIASAVCVCALLLPRILPAQSRAYRIEPLTFERGVSHQTVACLLQDRSGFMWLGTMFGLVKFEGYTYTTYRHDPRDNASLSNDDIQCLYEDNDGAVWIGTANGLNQWHRLQDRFTRYEHHAHDTTSLTHNNILAIAPAGEGKLWVGTSAGLNLFDKKYGRSMRFVREENDADGLSNDHITAVREDRNGTLWVGTAAGLHRLHKDESRFTRFRHAAANNAGASREHIRALFEDRFGVLWIGTLGGLLRYQPEQNNFIEYRHDAERDVSLSSDAVRLIYEDREGELWIGTNRGLNKYDRARDEFERHFEPNPARNNNGSGIITALVQDESDALWVGTLHSGVYKMFESRCNFSHYAVGLPNARGLAHNHVRAFCEDRTGTLWVGTAGGLQRFEDARQLFHTQNLPSAQGGAQNGEVVNALLADHTNTLWVATFNGLNRISPERSATKLYRKENAWQHGLHGNQITALHEDRRGAILVGTTNGVYCYERARDRFARVPLEGAEHDYVLSLLEDRRGVLWIGTYSGLLRWDSARQTLTRFQHEPTNAKSLGNNFCFALHEDREGVVWVGTGNGLHRFEASEETFAGFGVREGLRNSVICGIATDASGKLWLSTHQGLSCFDPATKRFLNFDLSDGLQSNMFNAGAFAQRRNGALLFGGINGFNLFHPASLRQNTHAPKVAITVCRVFDRARALQPDSVGAPYLRLTHRDNFFSFEFAALDFTQPEKNQYAYQLEGFDPAWVASGTRRYASYTNLPPGEYTFRVKASNNDGVWNENGARVRVVIAPPFWKTGWFIAACGLLLATLLAGLHQYRMRARLKQFAALEAARRGENERVRKKAANDFHDELGHRLTKIALFSELVKRKLNGASREVAAYLDKIIDDAQRLSHETRDFIWSLDPDKDSVAEIVFYLKNFAEELFDRTDAQVQVCEPDAKLQVLRLTADAKRQVTLIFKEGLHNILKHAHCRHVILEVRAEHERLLWELHDDGVGLNGHANGNGRGLENMRTRAGKLGGVLQLYPRTAGGTRLVLSMPCVTPSETARQTEFI